MDAIQAIDEELRRLNIIRAALLAEGKLSGRSHVEDSIRLLEEGLIKAVTIHQHVPFKYRITAHKEGK